jgi:hypothetical protein
MIFRKLIAAHGWHPVGSRLEDMDFGPMRSQYEKDKHNKQRNTTWAKDLGTNKHLN